MHVCVHVDKIISMLYVQCFDVNDIHFTSLVIVVCLFFISYNYSKTLNLIEILEKIADESIKATGFFHSGPELHCIQLHPHPE